MLTANTRRRGSAARHRSRPVLEALEGRCLLSGGFESPVVGSGYRYGPVGAGWDFSPRSGDSGSGVTGNVSGFTSGNPAAPEGLQVAFLQAGATISRSYPDLAAGTYKLTFLAAQRGNHQSSRQDFQATVDGRVVGTFVPSGTSYAAYASETFTVAAGAHTIAFRGLNSAGGDNTAFLDNIAITLDQSITVDAGPAQTALEGSPVTFRGSTSGTGELSFSWDFGDGTTARDTLTPQHTYLDNGTYTARLTVSNGTRTATSTTVVTVNNVAPTAAAGGPYSTIEGQNISLNASATDPSPTDQAAGFTYTWNFGDGTQAQTGVGLSRPNHTYALPGEYTVHLTLTDKDGGIGSSTAKVTIAMDDSGGHSGGIIHAGHDHIPDYGAMPTIVSIASGAWSNPNTWSLGRLPTTGDIVDIEAGTTVIYDVKSTVRLGTVEVETGGTLRFRTDVSTQLVAANILVLEGGVLEVGTPSNPVAPSVTASIVIADQAIDTSFDPEQFGTGLIGLGTVTMVGASKTSFIRLASEPKIGDKTLLLSQPASGWRAGDRLTLPDSRQLDWYEKTPNDGAYIPRWEEMVVQAVSSDGLSITLASSLAFDHPGARDMDGVLDFLPHVTNNTRNVSIRSENPAGTPGHTMFIGRASVDIQYVGLYDLGRTTNEVLDSTTFDIGGNVTHVGTNQIGRYPVHVHHVYGPSASIGGYQYRLIGTAVDNGTTPSKAKWGIALHDSHYGLIEENIVYNVAGAGFVTEDGSESYNVIRGNYAARIIGNGDRFGEGRDGVGFWFHGPNNYVRDNVATNIRGGVYSYGFNYYGYRVGSHRIPNFPGADTTKTDQSTLVDMNNRAILEFSGNEVYGATPNGLTIWWVGTYSNSAYLDATESVVKDFRAWNIHNWGYFGYETNNLTFDGFTIRGNRQLAAEGNGGAAGMDFSDYSQRSLVIRRADIQGMNVGIVPTVNDGGGANQLIEDSTLRNRTNVYVTPLWNVSYRSDYIPPRVITLRNVRFGNDRFGSTDSVDIYMGSGLPRPTTNLIVSDQIFVTDYNGTAGDNFQVYYVEQDSEYVMPATVFNSDGSPQLLGSPEAGLTNSQLWTKYGVARAGSIARSRNQRSRIRGYVG